MHTGRYLSQCFEIFTPKMRQVIIGSRPFRDSLGSRKYFVSDDTDHHFGTYDWMVHLTDIEFLNRLDATVEGLVRAFRDIYQRFEDGKPTEKMFGENIETRNTVGEFFTPEFTLLMREQMVKVWEAGQNIPEAMEEIYKVQPQLLVSTLLMIAQKYQSSSFYDLEISFIEGQTWLEIVEKVANQIPDFIDCKGIGFDYHVTDRIIKLILTSETHPPRIVQLVNIGVEYESTIAGTFFKYNIDRRQQTQPTS